MNKTENKVQEAIPFKIASKILENKLNRSKICTTIITNILKEKLKCLKNGKISHVNG